MQRRKTEPVYTPAATYRLQFNHTFTFDQATGIVDYLDELGISDLYASPFLMARPGSIHGYDVTDHSRFNPEIGDQDSFFRLSGELQKRGMGLIVGRKAFQRPLAEGAALIHAVQDVFLSDEVTIA